MLVKIAKMRRTGIIPLEMGMNQYDQTVLAATRRQFFAQGSRGLGGLALASLLSEAAPARNEKVTGALPGLPHFAPRAKRAIYLHMVGAPPQHDLFDYNPFT